MIYLILDTNIWLYLANGLQSPDKSSSKYYHEEHFNFLDKLKHLKQNGDIVLVVNEIILKEWERNKEHAFQNIERLKNKLKQKGFLDDYKKFSSEGDAQIDEMLSKYKRGISEQIELNTKHINNVEDFLKNECEIVEVADTLKLEVFELAISKKPPFHNEKNNVADTTILFSTLAHLNELPWISETLAIFVSNNTDEFTDGKNKKVFHPYINDYIEEKYPCVGLEYHNILPAALNFGEDVIKDMKDYYQKELEFERGFKDVEDVDMLNDY